MRDKVHAKKFYPAEHRWVDGDDRRALDLAGRLDAMKEGERTVLDNSCLLFVSNMWSGTKHDSGKVPVLLAGGLGDSIPTGRALDYCDAGDENRKLCSLYLSLMDRMGVTLDEFGDADTRLAGF